MDSKGYSELALARWAKVHEKERQNIKSNTKALKLKAAICGFLAGDGSVQYRKERSYYRSQIDFFPDDVLMRDKYLKAIKAVYKKEPSVVIRDNLFNVRITSNTILHDIRSIANFGLYKWTLPYSLFSIEGAKEAWLRAFFSAEGYVSKKYVRIQTVNRKGMLSISKVLKELCIEHKYYEYKPKNVSHSPVSIICIIKRDSKLRFLEKIGFWHSKKTKMLRKSLNL